MCRGRMRSRERCELLLKLGRLLLHLLRWPEEGLRLKVRLHWLEVLLELASLIEGRMYLLEIGLLRRVQEICLGVESLRVKLALLVGHLEVLEPGRVELLHLRS